MRTEYLACPECRMRRVTFRRLNDGDAYCCDRCGFTAYVGVTDTYEEARRRELAAANPHASERTQGRLAR